MSNIFSPHEASRSLDEGQAEAAERATWNLSNKLAHLDWPRESHTVEVRLDHIVPWRRHDPDGSDKIALEAVQRHVDIGWRMQYEVDDSGALVWVKNPVWHNPDQGINYPTTSIRPLDTTYWPLVGILVKVFVFGVAMWLLCGLLFYAQQVLFGR